MPWQEISLGTPELTAKDDGSVEWNMALQLLMGAPTWVELLYNQAEGLLGIRPVNAPSGFPVVAEPEGGEYKIYSAPALDAAAITISQNVTAAPDTWRPTHPAAGPSDYYGYEPIYYITLPE